jgi:hypothetical protein
MERGGGAVPLYLVNGRKDRTLTLLTTSSASSGKKHGDFDELQGAEVDALENIERGKGITNQR